MNKQLPNDAFAVLYRTNAQSRSIEEALRKLNIPYRIYSGLSFYSRKEIKDLLAYIRLTINHNDEDALLRIINMPARGIGKTTLEKLAIAADAYNVSVWEVLNAPLRYHVKINSGTAGKLDAFCTMIKSFAVELKKKDAFEVAQHIVSSSGLLRLYRQEDTPEGISRVENIEELLNAIKEFVESGTEQNEGDLEYQGTLDEFMQDVALLTDADKDDGNTDKVSLMSIHAAKGLEFPYVFIVGLEENLFPSIQSISTRTELEEERRLFYVALTRAMEKVTLSHAESRYRWGQFTITEPSRFLEEIDDSLIDKPKRAHIRSPQPKHGIPKKRVGDKFKAVEYASSGNQNSTENGHFEASDTTGLQTGMQVEHPKFGKGKVVAVEGQGPNKKATVFFNGIGNKNLLLRFAKLKILS
jgi:DNA helicase-2/ATP-dependent DNA helicase PcrA